jgi:putative DNA primase/helicase
MSPDVKQPQAHLCTRCNLRPSVYGGEKDGMCEPCFAIWRAEIAPPNAQAQQRQRLLNSPNLNARQKAALKRRAPKPQPICEENWGGECHGGCGKRVTGEFYCHDCRTKKAETNFMVKEGEVELYRGNVGKLEDKVIKQVVAVKGTFVKAELMTWMWKERLPDGAITWIVGQPGNAKSLLTIEIAACASTGRDWPDGEKNTMGAVKVLMFCGEDDLKRTVLPRLLAAKADMSNIDFLDSKSFRGTVGDSKVPGRSIDLDQDMETLLGMIKGNPEYKLLICDPITGIFGAKSINKDQEVNPILEELNTLCQGTGLTFLGVCHVPKRSTNSSMEKIAGGSSVAGKCRAAFMLSGDPDSDDKHDHLMTSVKTNLSGEKSGLKYKTVPTVVVQDGVEIPIVKIEWGEKTDMTADDVLLAQNSRKDDRDRQADKCEAFLLTYLAEEPKRSRSVYEEAKKQGYGESTVKRALENVGGRHIDGRNAGKGHGWWMALPGVDFPAPKEEKLMALAADEGL